MVTIKLLHKVIATVFVKAFKYASFDETGFGGVFIENAILPLKHPANTAWVLFSRKEIIIFILVGMFALCAFSISAIDYGGINKAKQFEKEKRYEEAYRGRNRQTFRGYALDTLMRKDFRIKVSVKYGVKS